MTSAPLLIVRPEPGAAMTAKRAIAEGWQGVISPIFAIEQVAWTAPDPAGYDALIVTSANAVRQAGPALDRYRSLPVYAVGGATARALKRAGFKTIRTGRGDAAALLALAAEDGITSALHLAGADHRDAEHDAIRLDRHIVYRSAPLPALNRSAIDMLGKGGAIVLLHSGRAGQHFAELCDHHGIQRSDVALAALSPAILESAGAGWSAAVAAETPDDVALLAAAARLCH
jgi:uroporphyrinogen-III synthase